MSAIGKVTKRSIGNPLKPFSDIRGKVDPANIFLPKDPMEPPAPIASKAGQSTVEGGALGRNRRKRLGYMFPSGMTQGVRP